MHWLTVCIVGAVLIVYLLVGGAIFMALEQDNETTVSTAQQGAFQQFLTDNTCVTAAELRAFAEAVINAYDSGVTASDTETSVSNWDYGPSVFFAITVVTSIGYGHVSPTTSGGQVFFAFYALLGIPLCAVFLAGLGEKMSKPYKKLEKKSFVPKHPKYERVGKLVLFNVICFVLFSIIPAAIFTAIEDWTYLEAWYYTVVTLTTVGFGDYVPGQSDSSGGTRAVYKLGVGVWIFLGLAWLAMTLSLLGDFMKEQAQKIDAMEDKDAEKNAGDDVKDSDVKKGEAVAKS